MKQVLFELMMQKHQTRTQKKHMHDPSTHHSGSMKTAKVSRLTPGIGTLGVDQ